ncbi:MAG: hypothetical protein ACREQ2_16480 [Candidatus Binatia bacterium]
MASFYSEKRRDNHFLAEKKLINFPPLQGKAFGSRPTHGHSNKLNRAKQIQKNMRRLVISSTGIDIALSVIGSDKAEAISLHADSESVQSGYFDNQNKGASHREYAAAGIRRAARRPTHKRSGAIISRGAQAPMGCNGQS